MYDAPPDILDRDLVFDFFWRFSVLECALKREGFLDQDGYGNAKPDWPKFSKTITGRLGVASNGQTSRALAFLQEHPPRRQVVRAGGLGWEDIVRKAGESDESHLITLVQTIRNNLFHGGKYPDGPVDDMERDKDLLKAALQIVEMFYELHPGLKKWEKAA